MGKDSASTMNRIYDLEIGDSDDELTETRTNRRAATLRQHVDDLDEDFGHSDDIEEIPLEPVYESTHSNTYVMSDASGSARVRPLYNYFLRYLKTISTREKLVAFIAFFSLIAIIILLVLYLGELGKSTKSGEKIMAFESGAPCTSTDCISTANIILSKMNMSESACDNFYAFSCGAFAPKLEQYEWSVDALTGQNNENMAMLRDLLFTDEDILHSGMKKYYDTCMDTIHIVKLGLNPLLLLLNDTMAEYLQIPAEPSDDDEIVSNNGWTNGTKSAFLSSILAMNKINVWPLFKLDIVSRDSKRHVEISPNGFGLQPVTLYHIETLRDQYIDIVTNWITDIFGYSWSGFNDVPISVIARQLVDLEYRLVKTVDKDTSADVLVVIDDLDNFPFGSYFGLVIGNGTFSLQNETIITRYPKYLEELSKVVLETDPLTLRNYIVWQFILKLTPTLDQSYQNSMKELIKLTLGASELPPRWKTCVSFASTAFPELSDKLLLSQTSIESEKIVSQQLQLIKDAYKAILNTSDASLELKQFYVNMLTLTTDNIGKHVTMNLSDLYRDLRVDETSFFHNTVYFNRFSSSKIFSFLKGKGAPAFSHDNPELVFAEYMDFGRGFYVSPGLLRSTFAMDRQAPAIQSAQLGQILSHALSSVIFSKYGLNEEDNELQFVGVRGKIRSLRQEYAKHLFSTLPPKLVSLAKIPDFMHDILTLENAWLAWRSFAPKASLTKLPGLTDYSDDQLFFIAYAQQNCAVERKQYTQSRFIEGVEASAEFKINHILRQFSLFTSAFCKS